MEKLNSLHGAGTGSNLNGMGGIVIRCLEKETELMALFQSTVFYKGDDSNEKIQ